MKPTYLKALFFCIFIGAFWGLQAQNISRWYANEFDEQLAHQIGWNYSSFNGIEWNVNDVGNNPLGHSLFQYKLGNLTYWSEQNGSLHPKSFGLPFRLNADSGIYNSQKTINWKLDLSFGNESGDPGIWSSTSKITPNSDRKGPDLNLWTQLTGKSSSLQLFGHYMSYALDDIPQIKRLKTISDGDALTGLRMPIIQSSGIGSVYNYQKDEIDLNLSLVIQETDRFIFDRVLAFELPLNTSQIHLGKHLKWQPENKKTRVLFEHSFLSEYTNHNQNAIQFRADNTRTLHFFNIELSQRLLPKINVGIRLGTEQNTLQNALISKTLYAEQWQWNTFLSLNLSSHQLMLSAGRNGARFSDLNRNEFALKWTYADDGNPLAIDFNLQRTFTPFFKVDPFLYTEFYGLNDRSMIDLQTWSPNHAYLEVDFREQPSTFYQSNSARLNLKWSGIGQLLLYIKNWEELPVLYTDYQYVTLNEERNRALPFVNQAAEVEILNNLIQFGSNYISEPLELSFDPSSKIGLSISYLYTVNMNRQNADGNNLSETPFPSLRSSFYWERDFRSQINAKMLFKYISDMSFTPWSNINGESYGLHQNTSQVDLGRYSSTTDDMLFLNLYLKKSVGNRSAINIFVDLNLPVFGQPTIHPIGAREHFTLFTGVRIGP